MSVVVFPVYLNFELGTKENDNLTELLGADHLLLGKSTLHLEGEKKLKTDEGRLA